VLEFRKPLWLALAFFARLQCYFWKEGFGERELFWTSEEPPAWYCDRCRVVLIQGKAS
jgi:hypothetical protein